jgi:pimeloyl-ACP methyl ester carboxylesterase
MLARYLAALLAAELGLYVIAAWLAAGHGVPLAWCLVLALATAVAIRLVLVGMTFALARRFRAARTRLPPWQAVRLFLGESFAFALLFALLQPLARWFARPPAPAPATATPPVLLIPGIYCNGAVWWWLVRRLRAQGLRNLFPLTLEPPLADIATLASRLAGEIERICEQTQAQRVVLVGHSMGGLIARAYLRDFGSARVARVVTLASPHHGSELARVAIGAGGAQLRPGNRWLAALNAAEHAVPPVPIVSLFSWHDNFVAPQDSAVLAHATNVDLTGVGHLALLFSEPVAQRVAGEIALAAQK